MKKSPVKVFHLVKSLGRGGAEMLLSETLKVHNRQYFEFHYGYFLPWKDQMVESLHANGGRVTCFEASNNLALMAKALRVAKYAQNHQIDIIHAHLPWAGIVARLVGKLTGIPVIYTEHNKQERYHQATRIVNLLTMNWQDVVVPVSADVAESLHKHKRGLHARVQTILNGVNTAYFNRHEVSDNLIREKYEIPQRSPIIGTVAVFRFQKRLEVWLECAARILKEHPDTHFIIVGDGPLKDDIQKRCNELGLLNRVHFPGLETEVRPYLAAFDIYMMSSIFEGLPIALLEAMSMECAIVATDAGGIKEVVTSGVSGLLCSTEEPLKLVDIASSLLSDQDLRVRLGREARNRVQAEFSMEKMVAALEQLYIHTLEK